MKLKNKVIVVTGGAGLLGGAFCRALEKEGAIVVIADANLDRAIALSQEIKGSFPVQVDITSEDSLKNAVELIHEKYRHIDGVVNNAYPRNKNYGQHFYDVTYKDFCENLNMNLGGYFLTSQIFLKYFKTQKSGNVVNVSSVYGVVAPRFGIYEGCEMTMPVEYAAIKSGLIHLTKYMAKYVSGENIRVNCISPGGILDKQPDGFLERYAKYCSSKGMLNPEDVSGTLIFLLSDDARFIHGQNIVVDDGFTL